jgi:hypothetical protein
MQAPARVLIFPGDSEIAIWRIDAGDASFKAAASFRQ